jgi:hypothetical protein
MPLSHLVRRPCNLPRPGTPRREDAGVQGVLLVTAGEERPLRVAGYLRLESEYIPGRRGPNWGLGSGGGGARGCRGAHPVGSVGPEQRRAEERAVRGRRRGRRSGGGGGGVARGGRGGEVKEREIGSGAAGDEAVAVDRAGRRRGRRGRRGGVRRRGGGAGEGRGGEARVGRGGRGGRLGGARRGVLHRRRWRLVVVVHGGKKRGFGDRGGGRRGDAYLRLRVGLGVKDFTLTVASPMRFARPRFFSLLLLLSGSGLNLIYLLYLRYSTFLLSRRGFVPVSSPLVARTKISRNLMTTMITEKMASTALHVSLRSPHLPPPSGSSTALSYSFSR